MDFFVISIASLLASLMTFFSGFGLGTILLPIFAIWFPIDLAVALTATVHLFNNLFKFTLVGKNVSKAVFLRFGLPAIISAFVGAAILVRLVNLAPIFEYQLFEKSHQIMPIKLMTAIVMIFFTLLEVIPKFKNLAIESKYLPLGGVLSGFFGGLSGHQGALRSAFLVRSGLSKESFIATGTAIACAVDLVRLSVYSNHFVREGVGESAAIVAVATISAFVGAYAGSKILHKITMNTVQLIVSVGLLVFALLIGSGLI